MGLIHFLGAAMAMLLIAFVAWFSGTGVKNAEDFDSGGHRAGSGIVLGTIMGTFVGGSATIGTSQLAFSYGLSAWWFTLGGGLACLILGFCYAPAIIKSRHSTITGFIGAEFGQHASTATTLLTAAGSIISIVAQIISGVALIVSVCSMPMGCAILLTVSLMLIYVLFGGIWGAGYVGIIKILLLYAGVGTGGVMAYSALYTDWESVQALFPSARYFHLFARGFSVDMGAGLAVILGVLSAQSYFQGITAARNLRQARIGIFAGALLIPLIGMAGIAVGLFMRARHPETASASALPLFILEYMPPLAAGGILATLLITVVGTGAGVGLGISSMFSNDLYKVYSKNPVSGEQMLRVSRICLVAVFGCAGLLAYGSKGSMILTWSVFAFALRASSAFAPFTAAVFFPGKICKRFSLYAILCGSTCVVLGAFLEQQQVSPLFLGISVCIGGLGLGYVRKQLPR